MFKLFKKDRNKKILLQNKKEYVKPEISKTLNYSENCGIKKLEIYEDDSMYNFCNYIVDLQNDKLVGWDLKSLNLRHIICESGSIDSAIVYKQIIYFFKNNNKDYVIAISKNIVKISERELIDKDTYESTLDINFDENKFSVGKYIHDEWMSTKYNKWYPEGIMLLDENDAMNTTIDLLNNLNKIDYIVDIISLEKLYYFLENNTQWKLDNKKSTKR